MTPGHPVPVRGLDVSGLPSFGFSHRSLVWWGTLGMMAVEGTVFAMAIATYFYLRSHATVWPLAGLPPELFWATVNTVLMLASALPNHYAKAAAEALDRQRARRWLAVCLALSLLFLAIRAVEFGRLNTGWDNNAYGSIVWTLLALHTTHLIMDTWDTGVLTMLLFRGPAQDKQMVDVSENAFYWNFVILSWLPIYAVVYWAPRLH